MLVVLVISAIIISLSLSILNLVQKNFNKLNLNFGQQTENIFITRKLQRDLNYYSRITIEKGKNLKFRNPLDSVQYRFENPFIIGSFDTLATDFKGLLFFYKGDRVVSGEIDAIKIKTASKENIFFISRSNAIEEKFRLYED